jgi:DNA-binding NtrC family response regulator
MLLIRLICAKTSRHLVDIAHSHEFSDDLTRFFNVIEVIFLTLFRERNAFDDDFDVNEIEEKVS